MPQVLADDSDRHAGLEGHGRMSVAEVVQPDLPQAMLLDQARECLAEHVRVDRLPVLLGDDQVLVLVGGAPFRALLVLPLTMRPEPLGVSASKSITRALGLFGIEWTTS